MKWKINECLKLLIISNNEVALPIRYEIEERFSECALNSDINAINNTISFEQDRINKLEYDVSRLDLKIDKYIKMFATTLFEVVETSLRFGKILIFEDFV